MTTCIRCGYHRDMINAVEEGGWLVLALRRSSGGLARSERVALNQTTVVTRTLLSGIDGSTVGLCPRCRLNRGE